MKKTFPKREILLYSLTTILATTFYIIFNHFQDYTISLSILHTGLLNGKVLPELHHNGPYKGHYTGGSALLSGKINELKNSVRSNAGHVLLLDTGSSLFGGNSLHRAEDANLIVKIMNKMKYDAMTIGNSDFDYGSSTLSKILSKAKFPVVAANVQNPPTKSLPSFLRPYTIKVVNGVRIGIIGIANPNMKTIVPQKRLEPYVFQDHLSYIEKYLHEFKQKKVDITILLAEFDENRFMIELAEKYKGEIDLIVANTETDEDFGHDIKIGDTTIIKTPINIKSIGKMDFLLDGKTKKIIKRRWSFHPVSSKDTIADNRIVSLIEQVGTVSKRSPLKRVIGHAENEMPGKIYTEGIFGNFITDIVINRYEADVVLINSYNLLGLSQGDITYEKLSWAIPYNDDLVEIRMLGKDIKLLLERGLENLRTFGILQQSGLRYEYNLNRPVGQRITNLEINNKPLKKYSKYRIITTNFLYQGKDGHTTFKKALSLTDLNIKLKKVVIDYIMKKGYVRSEIDNRIVNLTPQSSLMSYLQEIEK